MISCVNC